MIKLNLRLLLIFLEIAVIPVTLISYFALFHTKSAITTQILSQLDQRVSMTKNEVKDVISSDFEALKLLKDNETIIESLPIENTNSSISSDFFEQLDKVKLQLSDVQAVSILDLDGKVVVSTVDEETEKIFEKREFFLKSKAGRDSITFMQVENRKLQILISGPIYKEGELVGVATIFQGGSKFLSLFSETSAIGSSGELMLVIRDRNGDASYVTPSKFDQLGPLTRTTLKGDFSQSATRALLEEERTFSDSVDYRGEKVLSATRYIADTDWGLVAKIDQDEAYLALSKLRSLLLVVSLVSVTVIALISLSAATSIVAPIKRLIQMTNKISGGDFSHRAVIESRDEIGQLELSFNIMAVKLKRSYDSLEQKVRERTRELEESKRSLEIANMNLKNLDKLKDEFVSIASHELRTPMTAIKGLVSMIFEGDYGKVSTNLKGPLSDISTSTERLIVLVNELLNVSRIEAGSLKFELGEFKIKPFVSEIISSLEPLAKDKGLGLSFKYEGDADVQGDQNKVGEILNNLIGNALKFTDKGEIKITAREESELVKIFITDTGIGISKQDTSKLFGKFEQISTYQIGRPSGSGLGLYISRELARKMGGDLWLEKSESKKGSTFAFSLPIAKTKLADKVKDAVAIQAKAQESIKEGFKV